MQNTELFVYAFVSVCIGAGVITQLAPDGTLKKYLKYIVSLCVFAAMLSPLVNALGIIINDDTPISFELNTEEAPGDAEETLIEDGKKRIEDAIVSEISKKWDIPGEDISVSVVLDTSDKRAIEIREIKIYVANGANADEIKEYISGLFYGTAKVSVSEGKK